ncbi:hypothetical protein [Fodinibius sp. AD559]|uniref:hypothetical protein n=1 Tax=Fodinibius sp. AD559 TaxID=3424179 RepID=UPI004046C03C
MELSIGILAGIVGLIALVLLFISQVEVKEHKGDTELANILKWLAIALIVVFVLMGFLE